MFSEHAHVISVIASQSINVRHEVSNDSYSGRPSTLHEYAASDLPTLCSILKAFHVIRNMKNIHRYKDKTGPTQFWIDASVASFSTSSSTIFIHYTPFGMGEKEKERFRFWRREVTWKKERSGGMSREKKETVFFLIVLSLSFQSVTQSGHT